MGMPLARAAAGKAAASTKAPATRPIPFFITGHLERGGTWSSRCRGRSSARLARCLEVQDEPAERDLIPVVDGGEDAGGQLLAVEEGPVHRADLLGDEELTFLDHE